MTTKSANYYIIADHLRTIIFALADGAIFEPKGRGYILKKLAKKVVLIAHLLNLNWEDLRTISEELIFLNSSYYPYLLEKKNLIIIDIEKEITKSQKLISEAVDNLNNYYSPNITAQDIFFWYDTQGIPLPLIKAYLDQKNHPFPNAAFDELLLQQKEKGRTDRQKKKITVF